MMFILTLFLSIFRLVFSGFPMLETLYIFMVIVFSAIVFFILAKLTRDKPLNSSQSKWAGRGAGIGSLAGVPILYLFNIDVASPIWIYLSACITGLLLSVLLTGFFKSKNA